ncbi:hypothetical protein SR39_31115 [Methylobacterium radiotolerans]|nr:hypothetical protein SR39_31115 [Methylobacterium radiotolerans]
MTITVPAGAQDPACPPASQEGLEALLEVLPHRYKPGVRALLTGPDSSRPTWGHVYLHQDWLASAAALLGLGPSWIRPGESIPIRFEVEYDARLGLRLVVSASDWPTPAQVAADAELRRSLEEQGRWRQGRAPERLRQLFALVPENEGPRWAALALQLQNLDECRIVSLAVRPVDLDDADAVRVAFHDAAEFVHWTGADAVLVVTGDRRVGSRVFSAPHVVEAACAVGAPLVTLAGPVPTLVDALAWRSSPIPGAVQAAIEDVLRGELTRADRARLDRIEEVLTRPRTAPGSEAWPSDAPF